MLISGRSLHTIIMRAKRHLSSCSSTTLLSTVTLVFFLVVFQVSSFCFFFFSSVTIDYLCHSGSVPLQILWRTWTSYSTLVTQIIFGFLRQYYLPHQVKQVSTILTVFFFLAMPSNVVPSSDVWRTFPFLNMISVVVKNSILAAISPAKTERSMNVMPEACGVHLKHF